MSTQIIVAIVLLIVSFIMMTISRIRVAILMSSKNSEIKRLEKEVFNLKKSLSKAYSDVSKSSFIRMNQEYEIDVLKNEIKHLRVLLNQRWNNSIDKNVGGITRMENIKEDNKSTEEE